MSFHRNKPKILARDSAAQSDHLFSRIPIDSQTVPTTRTDNSDRSGFDIRSGFGPRFIGPLRGRNFASELDIFRSVIRIMVRILVHELEREGMKNKERPLILRRFLWEFFEHLF